MLTHDAYRPDPQPHPCDFPPWLRHDDPLNPARGLAWGVAIGAALWALLGGATWYLFWR